VLLFTLKFIFNLWEISQKIRKNPHLKTKRFINVLLEDLVIPHTFFNFIFLDKYKFEAQKIPKEVLLHEQTHATQQHSLDILFIELLQIVFWFNPLIYFAKRTIKLNHEFLADQAVLNYGTNTSTYQNILLSFSSTNYHPQLTNPINYSFIKKRFKIMKTHTSKRTSWLKSLILLPLLAGLIYGFSEKVTIEKLTPQIQEAQPIKMSTEVNKTFEKLNTQIEEFETYRTKQDKASPEQIAEYNRLAKKYADPSKEVPKNGPPFSKTYITIKQKEVKRMTDIYSLMTSTQKKKAMPFPNIPPPPPPPAIDKSIINKGSKELKAVSKQFYQITKQYTDAIRKYYKTKENYSELKPLYKKVMDVHNVYDALAKKEKVVVPPPPPPAPEVIEEQEIIEEVEEVQSSCRQ